MGGAYPLPLFCPHPYAAEFPPWNPSEITTRLVWLNQIKPFMSRRGYKHKTPSSDLISAKAKLLLTRQLYYLYNILTLLLGKLRTILASSEELSLIQSSLYSFCLGPSLHWKTNHIQHCCMSLNLGHTFSFVCPLLLRSFIGILGNGIWSMSRVGSFKHSKLLYWSLLTPYLVTSSKDFVLVCNKYMNTGM